jgi:hypothetical protein
MAPVGFAWHERDRLRLSECRRRHTNSVCTGWRPNNLLDRLSVKSFQRMNNTPHRLCVALMMDR